jgi:S-adenosylmethionine decarboxylase
VVRRTYTPIGADDTRVTRMKEPTRLDLGLHVLLDLAGCPADRLSNREALAAAMRDAAISCGATIVGEVFHRFTPEGVSGVLLIAESHLSVHTWPERGVATLDVYTCGEEFDALEAARRLAFALGATESHTTCVRRGTATPQPSRLA